MSFEILLTYILAVIIIVSIPGPNIILIINDSIKHGFNKSLYTILGIKLGTSFLFLVSLSGLTALLSLFSSMFAIIKWVGVFYLIYLGTSQIISSLKETPVGDKYEDKDNNFLLKGFMISVTNPKGLLFAGAFFPQFINDQLAIWPQILILCGGFLLISFIIEIIYAYISDTTGKMFKSNNFKIITERVSGVFLIMFGLGLSLVKKSN